MARRLPLVTSPQRFEELAAEALDALPDWVRERMDNVEIVIEEDPPSDEPGLLGKYEGVPLTRRAWYTGVLPDRIALFRSTIEREAPWGDEETLRRVIAHTVEHEVAHYFGISDERLRDIDRY